MFKQCHRKHYYSTSKNVACTFQPSFCFLTEYFITLSRKPGKNLVIVLSACSHNYDLSLSTTCRLTNLLRFKLNQITRKRSGRTRLTMLLRWEIFTRRTRKPWLNQAYHASEVGVFNQAYQETLVKPGLPSF